ncbi:hypothetical protein [Nocardiopsis sp. CNT312]|uniref:hypothetical protein n=1 Tax=Nocardiopsis sp. CNT312 TaxID=1137268 RepID=UPI0004AF4F52|nr:hypothetical protein [Nocardiopsis sp. CNT312]
MTSCDDPTILAARREMQSWRRLALEPTALRTANRSTGPQVMGANGLHLPGTLFRIARQEPHDDPDRVYARVSGRLADLVGLSVDRLHVAEDEVRQLLAVELQEADGMGRDARVHEIASAIRAHMPEVVHVPIVPVRMTKAWLLVDEGIIRRVAGSPNGRCRLGLPSVHRVEKVPDPKATLKQILAKASELSGRRLDRFNKRFSENRRQPLQRLDTRGPVTELPSWQAFVQEVEHGLDRLGR